MVLLHECIQRRMTHQMAYSPYTPKKEDLEIPEDWAWAEADRLEEESKAAEEEEAVEVKGEEHA